MLSTSRFNTPLSEIMYGSNTTDKFLQGKSPSEVKYSHIVLVERC